jgi:site-specific DNA-methyltransferase (adenine-specific)
MEVSILHNLESHLGSDPRAQCHRVEGPGGNVIELFNVDCEIGLRNVEAESVDCIVTSPPYNLGIAYSRYDDTLPRGDYLAWLGRICEVLKTKLKPDGSFFLNIGSVPSNPWGPFEVITSLRPRFVLQNVIHWVKSIYVENETYEGKQSMNVGHYKPINSARFLNDTQEYIFHLTKTGSVPINRLAIGVPYKDQNNIARWKAGGVGIRCRGNSWYVPYKTINSRQDERPHPASFPPEIAELCIRLHGQSGAAYRVMDPFMGIGNTALACKNLGVSCIGFEIDPDYFQTSRAALGPQRTFTIR